MALWHWTAIRRAKGSARATSRPPGHGPVWFDDLAQDGRYAFRLMRRVPALTTTIVLTLALGLGANTAIFTLIDVLMLRQLPVREPARLVEFVWKYPGDPRMNFFNPRNYEQWSNHPHRWMNAPATAATVKGTFTEAAAVSSQSGRATFSREADQYFMRLERGCMIQQGKPVFFCYYQAFKEGKNVVRLSKTTKDASLYLRLERRGEDINASMSYDGKTWHTFKGQAIKLPEQVQVGVSAVNNTSKPLTAVFEDFTITSRSK